MPTDATQAFIADLSRIIQACRISGRNRACLLATRDRGHAQNAVCTAATGCGEGFSHWSLAGRRTYNPKTRRYDNSGGGVQDVAGLLQAAQEAKGGVILFEDCIPFMRDDGGDPRARMMLAQILMGEARGRAMVLVFMEPPESETRLPGMLADQFTRLSVPYPRIHELTHIALEEVAVSMSGSNVQMPLTAIKEEAPRLASGLVGLTRSAARDALVDALALNPTDFDSAFRQLNERKASQLRRELAMNVLSTDDVEEPIGLDYLLGYLKMVSPKMRMYGGSERARGVLLVGPPGTGKTMLARAIGKLVELPVVEFRLSSLMNSLLGETERRFAQAFATLEAMAPNIVFIDEIEKAFGDSSERDGGTMMRCTGALLSWLSDNPYPNYIVATCNSLSRMGEIGLTMTRSERFDTAFFLDVPNLESRKKMLSQWLEGAIKNPRETATAIAAETEKFSGADLRSLVKQAKAMAEYNNTPLTAEMLMQEAQRKRMRAEALYDEFRGLRRWSIAFCEPAGPTGN